MNSETRTVASVEPGAHVTFSRPPKGETELYADWTRAVREAKTLEAEYVRRAEVVGNMEQWRDEAHSKYVGKVNEILNARRALEAHLTGASSDEGIE